MAFSGGQRISDATLGNLEEVIKSAMRGHGGFGGTGSAIGGINDSYGGGYGGGGYDGGGYPSSLREIKNKFMANREELKYSRDFSDIKKAKEEETFNKLKENILKRRGKFDTKDEERARKIASKSGLKEAKEGADLKRAERADVRAKGAAAAAVGQEIGQKIGDAINEIMDLYLTWFTFQEKTTIAHNKMMHAIMLNKMNNYGKILSSSIKNTVGSFIGGSITESANAMGRMGSEAMSSMVNMATTQLKEETAFYTQKMEGQMNAQNKTIQTTANTLAGIAGACALIPGIGWVAAGVLGVVSGALSGIAKAYTSFQSAKLEIAMENLKEFTDFQIETTEKVTENITSTMEPIIKMSEDIQKEVLKLGTVIMKTVGEFNYGEENIEKYKNALFNVNFELANLGKTLEDYGKIQTTYSEGTGRAINLSGRDAMNVFATARLYGLDDSASAQLYSDMNIFNMSIEDGSDMLTLMYKKVSNMGLSTRKFGKDLAKNMKLAEKYDFKNGVKGLAEMTAWAEKMRFNMDNLPSALDKIQEGGIEDVLSNSAQLQVLGGNFAMYSDPMAMIYEGFNDPDAYAKRLTEMTKGMGYFDKSIGSVHFSMSDQIMLRQYAKTAGLDYNDVRKQINEQMKQGEVMKTLRGSSWSDEQKGLLSSKAQWDKDEQTWKVNVMEKNAQGQYEYVSKKLSDIGAEDIKNIVPEDTDEQMIDIAKKQLSYEEQTANATLSTAALLEKSNYGVTEAEAKKRIDIQQSKMYEIDEKMKYAHPKIEEIKTKNYEVGIENTLAILDKNTKLMDAYFEGQNKAMERFRENMIEHINFLAELQEDITKHKGILGDLMTSKLGGSAKGYQEKVKMNVAEGNIEDYVDENYNVNEEYRNDDTQRAELSEAIAQVYQPPELDAITKIVGMTPTGQIVNTINSLFGIDDDIRADYISNMIKNGLLKYDKDSGSWVMNSEDGIISPNGSPHLIPINDGFVKTHPNDTILAAKPGGPFDTLFDGIFGMVKEIHSALTISGNGNINVNVNGGIDLKSNGMNIENLRNNEMLKRAITEVVLENMSNKVNGGKNDMWKTNFRQ